MTAYNYPDCTTAVTIVLSIFRRHNAEHRSRDINLKYDPSFRVLFPTSFSIY